MSERLSILYITDDESQDIPEVFSGSGRFMLCKTDGESGCSELFANSHAYTCAAVDMRQGIGEKGYDFTRLREAAPNLALFAVVCEKDERTCAFVAASGADDVLYENENSSVAYSRIEKTAAAKTLIPDEQTHQKLIALERNARYDSLTGIYNRHAFYESTALMLQTDDEHEYVMLFCDIARFKVINDLFGTDTGDCILVALAEKIRNSVYGLGTFGRLESDHFAVCCRRDSIDTQALASEINESLKGIGINYHIYTHIGAYIIDDRALPIDQMCDRANLAHESIKDSFVRHYAVYDSEMRNIVLNEQRMTNEMESALESGQFCLHFQPIYSVMSGKPVSAEALVRWNHPQKGMIYPGEFIPLFESNGFITKLDYYVWREACRYLRRAIDERLSAVPISVSVNVSRLDFYNEQLCEELCALTREFDLSPELLSLEVTETAYNDNPSQIHKTLLKLREHGFRILMDDFGSGYSSLNVLMNLPIDILKLDMKFVNALSESESAGKIMKSVVRMAKSLKMTVIAEGVETEAQRDFLRSIGCDRIQGYYYSKPMDAPSFRELVVRELHGSETESPKTELDYFALEQEWEAGLGFNMLFGGMIGALGIFAKKEDGLYPLKVNESYNKLTGLMSSEVLNVRFEDALQLHENSKNSIGVMCKNAVTASKSERLILCRTRKSGEAVKCEIMLRFLGVYANEEIFCLYAKDLVASADMYETLYNYLLGETGVVCFTYDYRLQQLTANDEFKKLAVFGIAETLENQDSRIPLFVHPSDVGKMEKFVLDVRSGKPVSGVELRMLMRDGRYVWYRIIACHERDDFGKALRTIGLMLDIEDSKRNRKYESSKEQLQGLIDSLSVGVGIYELTSNGIKTLFINDITENMLSHGASVNDENRYVPSFLNNQKCEILAEIRSMPFGRHTRSDTFKLRGSDGAEKWVQAFSTIVSGATHAPLVYTVLADVTEQLELQRDLYKQNEKNKLLLESSGLMVFDYDVENDTMSFSIVDKSGRRFERTIEEYCVYMPQSIVIHQDYRQAFIEGVSERFPENDKDSFEYLADYFGDGYAWYRANYSRLRDENGMVFRVIGSMEDISREKETAANLTRILGERETLRARAEHDPLTGILNRVAFEESVSRYLEKNKNPHGAFMVLDLDDFKSINDTYGHVVGDDLLSETAKIIVSSIGSENYAGRLGGDEFTVFVRRPVDDEYICAVCDSITRKMKALSRKYDANAQVTISIGIAVAPDCADTYAKLYAAADTAMYSAKRLGKNQYYILDASELAQ